MAICHYVLHYTKYLLYSQVVRQDNSPARQCLAVFNKGDNVKIMGKAPSDVLKKFKKTDKDSKSDNKKGDKKNAMLSFIAKCKKSDK